MGAVGAANIVVPSFISSDDIWGKAPTIARPKLVTPPPSPLPQEVTKNLGGKFINLYNTHTGETLKKFVFWEEGAFIPEAKTKLDHFFRDHRTGDVKEIDPMLIELLHNLQQELDTQDPIQLVSGYRSPKTNAMLRKRSSGVAKKSRHLSGQAADINLPGRLKHIQAYAKKMAVGGVGRYASFVHVDTGPIRYWGKC